MVLCATRLTNSERTVEIGSLPDSIPRYTHVTLLSSDAGADAAWTLTHECKGKSVALMHLQANETVKADMLLPEGTLAIEPFNDKAAGSQFTCDIIGCREPTIDPGLLMRRTTESKIILNPSSSGVYKIFSVAVYNTSLTWPLKDCLIKFSIRGASDSTYHCFAVLKDSPVLQCCLFACGFSSIQCEAVGKYDASRHGRLEWSVHGYSDDAFEQDIEDDLKMQANDEAVEVDTSEEDEQASSDEAMGSSDQEEVEVEGDDKDSSSNEEDSDAGMEDDKVDDESIPSEDEDNDDENDDLKTKQAIAQKLAVSDDESSSEEDEDEDETNNKSDDSEERRLSSDDEGKGSSASSSEEEKEKEVAKKKQKTSPAAATPAPKSAEKSNKKRKSQTEAATSPSKLHKTATGKADRTTSPKASPSASSNDCEKQIVELIKGCGGSAKIATIGAKWKRPASVKGKLGAFLKTLKSIKVNGDTATLA